MTPNETLAQAGMRAIKMPKGFVLMDPELDLYRSSEILESNFAWVRTRLAAACFRTRRLAVRVARACRRGPCRGVGDARPASQGCDLR